MTKYFKAEKRSEDREDTHGNEMEIYMRKRGWYYKIYKDGSEGWFRKKEIKEMSELCEKAQKILDQKKAAEIEEIDDFLNRNPEEVENTPKKKEIIEISDDDE